jgi:hypothetical protein
MKKIKLVLILFFILFSVNLYSEEVTKPFEIKWNVKYDVPNVKGDLTIKNDVTGKEFKITAKDFLIREKAYKNWRVLEVKTPIITDLEQEDDDIIVTFNYFDDDTKSILSGKFIVSVKYIAEQVNKQKETILIGGWIGTAVYAFFVTLLILL